MTYYHEDCGGKLRLYNKGMSAQTSTWYCPKCENYTNEITEEKPYECPECGIMYESRRDLINHFNNDGAHPYIRDYFRTDDGNFRNPILEEIYNSYIEFRNSWYDCKISMTDYFIGQFGKLPDEEEVKHRIDISERKKQN